ncbi:MAG: T9SS type B sorting domain-containing protein [Cytophagales bacterium]|nr:MAG: hypothetical protein CND58_00630 [Rhodothermaeota bacterium MED-G16]
MLKIKLTFFLLLIYSVSLSQTSDLGRFKVNINKGCVPLQVEIISENVDPSVTVIQYDFDYNLTNNLFNPSGSKLNTYTNEGKFIIAQAINQDGVEKIDILEIDAFNAEEIDLNFFNCKNNKLEIQLNDTYYEKYKLVIEGDSVGSINYGSNEIDYSKYLGSKDEISGFIVGMFGNNDLNCSKQNFKISPIDDKIVDIIDSVVLQNDKFSFDVFYNLDESTNYNLLLNNSIDSTFLSSSSLINSKKVFKVSNNSLMNRCISLEKIYKCSDQLIEDKICLIYLNAFQSKRGNEIEFNYVNEFDSIKIYKNENLIKTLYEKSNLFIDNNGILKGYEYCYKVVGFKENKKSISNIFCINSFNNFNPIPIPNAFTPNNDGLNDTFKPFSSNVSEYKMYIFNKLGEKVFESNDINIGWDGYFKGKIIQDSYVYKIEFNKDNERIYINGNFLLIK